jgi:hypothetical protein
MFVVIGDEVKFVAKKCYYCGTTATSKEHAPPRQMFRGFDCDSITVPACEKHNTEKSRRDHAILTAFMMSLHNAKESGKRYSFLRNHDVLRAINLAEDNFHQSKKFVTSRRVVKNPPPELGNLPKMAYLDKSADISNWVRLLTAALVCSVNKDFDPAADWEAAKVFSFDYWEFPGEVEREKIIEEHEKIKEIRDYLENLEWIQGWSAHPRPYPSSIYHFYLHIDLQGEQITFKHRFYSQYTWYVRLNPSTVTRDNLLQKIGLKRY